MLHRSDLPQHDEIALKSAEGSVLNSCFPILAGLIERMRTGRGLADVPREVGLSGLLLCHHGLGDEVEKYASSLREALEAWLLATQNDRIAYLRLRIEPALERRTSNIPGLYELVYGEQPAAEAPLLAADWLQRFIDLPCEVEMRLADALLRANAHDQLRNAAKARSDRTYRDRDHLMAWLAVELLLGFNATASLLKDVGRDDPDFLWAIRARLQRRNAATSSDPSIALAEWTITQFRGVWPYTSMHEAAWGDDHPHNATDFLMSMLTRLASDPTEPAVAAMSRLIAGPQDSYTTIIRHRVAEQRQMRAEKIFTPVAPAALGALLLHGTPANAEDLKAMVVEELGIAAGILAGDDLDQVRDFWGDDGVPYDENRCRDRLAAMVGPSLLALGIQRITEADMPASKRADLAFASGRLQLPMEVKGQWHDKVWDAASGQLDALYLNDWRSDERGIYCVLWFGDLPSATRRRLKAPPAGEPVPTTAEMMREILLARLPATRRPLIEVIVLDLSRGSGMMPSRPTTKARPIRS